LHAKESSALAFATDTPQSDDNPSPRSSDSEKVEEPTESTTTKPVENTQPITVQPETSNAAVVAEKSEATADLAQPNRSRRVRRDATPTGQQNSVTTGVPIGTGPAGADDATSTPRVPMFWEILPQKIPAARVLKASLKLVNQSLKET
ncbi:hypothetical protein MK407_00255, partial [Streptococcus sanguinis]|uniref:hypothetical protein n=1 Tax=Streptococcus sanguinis TaxID=1305 RepID=UPI00228508B7